MAHNELGDEMRSRLRNGGLESEFGLELDELLIETIVGPAAGMSIAKIQEGIIGANTMFVHQVREHNRTAPGNPRSTVLIFSDLPMHQRSAPSLSCCFNEPSLKGRSLLDSLGEVLLYVLVHVVLNGHSQVLDVLLVGGGGLTLGK